MDSTRSQTRKLVVTEELRIFLRRIFVFSGTISLSSLLRTALLISPMTHQYWLCAMIILVVAQRLLELRYAERNRQMALAHGAREFGAEHYFLFIILHTAWLLGWLVEGLGILPALTPRVMTFGDSFALLEAFLLAQGLRYWAILSLGEAWNTRILIVPGAERVRKGPYKWVNHPNYIAVAIELACGPLIFGAWRTALVATLANALLLLFVRIPAENKAMADLMNDPNNPFVD
jgi:methyltransferase